ncbi:ERF family protein [Salinisphaera sp. G21_0]|uniref:ERF family protein n=1 Tax=Salinisphaera sp. G21_0 TaxID=2821094 RepID=UPI001ADB07B4|nr:ERF family protein [Salinisphaera sp. G21_0]MBO9484262.1 ERF family protein [Salinisphaera sp. G21_0]
MPAKKKTELIESTEVLPVDKPESSALSEVGQIMQSAIAQNASIDTLERVMSLYEQSQSIVARQQFNEAFARFQQEMPVVKKSKSAAFNTKSGGRMEYSYASIDDVVAAVQPVLHRYGLSYWFEQQQNGPSITITCNLGHVSGHSICNTATGPVDNTGNKSPLQQIGSTVTYLKRQTLVGILGVACTDDDTDGYVPDMNGDTQPQTQAHYPDADFQRHLSEWRASIESGKQSADRIIRKIKSKAPPTPQQVQQLKAIQPRGH